VLRFYVGRRKRVAPYNDVCNALQSKKCALPYGKPRYFFDSLLPKREENWKSRADSVVTHVTREQVEVFPSLGHIGSSPFKSIDNTRTLSCLLHGGVAMPNPPCSAHRRIRRIGCRRTGVTVPLTIPHESRRSRKLVRARNPVRGNSRPHTFFRCRNHSLSQ
jgi:hypothetical protein